MAGTSQLRPIHAPLEQVHTYVLEDGVSSSPSVHVAPSSPPRLHGAFPSHLSAVGLRVGLAVGAGDGLVDGLPVGLVVGLALGLADGLTVGQNDGDAVGTGVGENVEHVPIVDTSVTTQLSVFALPPSQSRVP